VFFLPHNLSLLTKTCFGKIKIWNPRTGTLQRTFNCKGSIKCLSTDGRYAAISQLVLSKTSGFRVLDVNTGTETPLTYGAHKQCGAFFHNSSYLASGSYKPLEITDIETEKSYNPLPGNSNNVSSIAISPSNKRIVAGDIRGNICTWEFLGQYAIGK
jgi:WD40 repeat protein